MVEVTPLRLAGLVEIRPRRFGDSRGFFCETYNRQALLEAGIDLVFVQDNQSYSAQAGVLRGLHYQVPPRAQDKLVRVMRGRIFDVAVDLRRASPTFGQWAGIEISAGKGNQLLVPVGFAHGFVTLEADTEVLYKVTDYYAPASERAIRYDDPEIGIDWPTGDLRPQLSAKDEAAGPFAAAVAF